MSYVNGSQPGVRVPLGAHRNTNGGFGGRRKRFNFDLGVHKVQKIENHFRLMQ